MVIVTADVERSELHNRVWQSLTEFDRESQSMTEKISTLGQMSGRDSEPLAPVMTMLIWFLRYLDILHWHISNLDHPLNYELLLSYERAVLLIFDQNIPIKIAIFDFFRQGSLMARCGRAMLPLSMLFLIHQLGWHTLVIMKTSNSALISTFSL